MATEKDKVIAELCGIDKLATGDKLPDKSTYAWLAIVDRIWEAARADAIEECAKKVCPLCAGRVPSDIEVKPEANGLHVLIQKQGYHKPMERECAAAELRSLSRKQEEPR